MGHRRRTPGLRRRPDRPGGIWHIKKTIEGEFICESTGSSDLEEAERYLAKRREQIRTRKVYGDRPKRPFKLAAQKYVEESLHKASIDDDAMHLDQLDPYIGDLYLEHVHDDTLAAFVDAKRKAGRAVKSVNNALGVVRRILNLAARSWRDENGLTWLEQSPLITMIPLKGWPVAKRRAYPLSWDEQRTLFSHLPLRLSRMCLFKVNTGTREQEVCGLRWEWERQIGDHSVFIVPWDFLQENFKGVKNGDDRLIVCNRVAQSVIDAVRGEHDEIVFPYKKGTVKSMNNTAWKRAWRDAGLPVENDILRGVHNLKHTFGRRLRAAGVSIETRKVLLGHSNGDITTHYSAPEILELINAANKVCEAPKVSELALVYGPKTDQTSIAAESATSKVAT